MTITIKRLPMAGWYSFADVPQGYIKVRALNVGTDEKAIKQAVKLNPNYDYEVK